MENVSKECIGACSYFLDMDSVIDNPKCLPDFDKIMKCYAGMTLINLLVWNMHVFQ